MASTAQQLSQQWSQLGSGVKLLVSVTGFYMAMNLVLNFHRGLEESYLYSMQAVGVKEVRSNAAIRDAKELQQLPSVKRVAESKPSLDVPVNADDVLHAFFSTQKAEASPLVEEKVVVPVKPIPKVYVDPVLSMHPHVSAVLQNGVILNGHFYPFNRPLSAFAYYADEVSKRVLPVVKLQSNQVLLCGYKDCRLLTSSAQVTVRGQSS